jgi:hypothetical protein
VDLLVYIEKAVALEVLSAFMEELRSESVNLRTRKRLDAILLAAIDAGHRIDRLRRQLKHLLRRIGAFLPLAARFVLLSLRTSTPTGLRPPPKTQRSEQQRGHYPTACRRCQ